VRLVVLRVLDAIALVAIVWSYWDIEVQIAYTATWRYTYTAYLGIAAALWLFVRSGGWLVREKPSKNG
jgi:hypothetical protein